MLPAAVREQAAMYGYAVVEPGAVIATRLSESGQHRVLLLEYGGSDRSILVQMPSALSIPMRMAKYDWRYFTEPEPGLANRRIDWPRGKVLGGSSAINGMVYTRGNRQDYDQWAQLGLREWSYEKVLPFFKRSENFADGANEYHGSGGPLEVTRPATPHTLYDSFVDAADQFPSG